MKTLIGVVAIGLFLFSAFAAQTVAAQDKGSDKIPPSRTLSGRQAASTVRVSQLMNMSVNDSHGQSLGKIEDLVISETGGMNYAVLSGPDNKLFPIPLTLIYQGATRGQLYTNITRDQLRSAPGFTRGSWPDLAGAQWQQKLFSYYGGPSPGMGMTGMQPGMSQEVQPGEMQPGMNQGAGPGMGVPQPQGQTPR